MNRPILLSRLVVSLGLTFSMSAQALTLGKLSVLSSLGQPLIAEIEVPDISAEESNSIRVGIASAEAFKSAGLDYTPAVAQMNVVGKRRTDGRAILELRSAQPITAPYLDLVLEVTWNAGRMLRDYTVLLDPPATSTQALVVPVPTLPIQSMSLATDVQSAPVPSVSQASATELPPLASATPAPLPNVRAATRPVALKGVTTKRGDTAAALANNSRPEGVSLDQMLVAMLRRNPNAFVAGNVNRLKTGVLLDVPSTDEIRAITPSAARSSIQAQAGDFNDYRKKLSSNVVATAPDESGRSASGKVVAHVADRQSVPTSDDRLTLAKPIVGNKIVSPETKIAQEHAAADSAARTTELKKNIDDLSKLSPAVALSASASVAPASAPITAAVPLPVPLVAVVPPPSKPQNRPPPPPLESSFLDQIIMNPLTLPIAGGVGLLVLVAGWLGIRRRRKFAFGHTQMPSQNFSATRQPSDTIFGPMGASDVDTKESPASTTMVYSPSQLAPTTGDVDPIAEADVYLAYNRDVQAEEILKAAKLDTPTRTDVRLKLLEIYAKRRDTEAFNADAQDLHMLTDGAGADWYRARELAKDIGSSSALFNASPVESAPAPVSAAATAQTEPHFQSTSGLIDFDMNSFSLDLHDSPVPVSVPASVHTLLPETVSAFNLDAVEDPKLALAEEYLSIGDHAGARSLIEEVIRQNAHPQIVTQAHHMLARLG